MFELFRKPFRSSPVTITVYPAHGGGWVVNWREPGPGGGPSDFDCETKSTALDFAVNRRERLLIDGARAEIDVRDEPPTLA